MCSSSSLAAFIPSSCCEVCWPATTSWLQSLHCQLAVDVGSGEKPGKMMQKLQREMQVLQRSNFTADDHKETIKVHLLVSNVGATLQVIGYLNTYCSIKQDTLFT